MTFKGFRNAVRENVGLIIGLVGSSGSGKTKSAMELAAGIVGPGKKFAVIDTEGRRALHYASDYDFDHGEIVAPFRPATYVEAIVAAEKAGYGAIVVDSASHEHYGDGGLLEWHDQLLGEFVKRDKSSDPDWKKREKHNMRAWIEPKTQHKKMVQRLLQLRSHLILCFRAEEKTGMQPDRNGKMQVVNLGWQPVCEKTFPYELTVSLLLTDEKPGEPVLPALKLQDQHKHVFPAGKKISQDAGRLIAEWAGGGAPRPSTDSTVADPETALGLKMARRFLDAKDMDELNALAEDLKSAVYLDKSVVDACRDAFRVRREQLA